MNWGVPVVPAVARRREGIEALLKAAAEVAAGVRRNRPHRIGSHPAAVEQAVNAIAPLVAEEFPELPNARWVALRLLNADERVTEAVRSGEIGRRGPRGGCLHGCPGPRPHIEGGDPPALDAQARLPRRTCREPLPRGHPDRSDQCAQGGTGGAGAELDRRLDRWLTSRVFGFPLMLGILAVVFWLTIAGANAPSAMLATLLIDNVHPALGPFAEWARMPWWLSGFLFDGVYLATAWVVSVMLPPMAIFFPLFTLLEDFGYLPRVAFNLDSLFRRAGRARQAGAYHEHGVRLQRGRGRRHARDRQSQERPHRGHHQQLLAVQTGAGRPGS